MDNRRAGDNPPVAPARHILFLRPMLTPLSVLRAVRELLSDEAAWIKHHDAMTKDGDVISTINPAACRFCLSGAIDRITYTNHPPDIYLRMTVSSYITQAVVELNLSSEGQRSVILFNDYGKTTHSDVLRVLDYAMKLVPEDPEQPTTPNA